MQEIPTIYSNQEETATRVVVYLHYAASLGYKDAVVRTPDTDIFVILDTLIQDLGSIADSST